MPQSTGTPQSETTNPLIVIVILLIVDCYIILLFIQSQRSSLCFLPPP